MFITKNLIKLPIATFFVTKPYKYRFRVVSPGFTLCPVLLSIDDHEMLMIASDTGSLIPQRAKSFIIHSGERLEHVLYLDFVITISFIDAHFNILYRFALLLITTTILIGLTLCFMQTQMLRMRIGEVEMELATNITMECIR
jgi:hypothetical protein